MVFKFVNWHGAAALHLSTPWGCIFPVVFCLRLLRLRNIFIIYFSLFIRNISAFPVVTIYTILSFSWYGDTFSMALLCVLRERVGSRPFAVCISLPIFVLGSKTGQVCKTNSSVSSTVWSIRRCLDIYSAIFIPIQVGVVLLFPLFLHFLHQAETRVIIRRDDRRT